MVSIGNLGTERDQVDLDFGYFGETIRVNPDASESVGTEFAIRAQSIDEDNLAAATVATSDFLRSLIHPEDFDRFLRTSVKNRQQTTDLLATAGAILEALSGFPTSQPSVSSDGPRITGTTSTAAPSWQDLKRRFEAEGRPDKALALVQAAEARGEIEPPSWDASLPSTG